MKHFSIYTIVLFSFIFSACGMKPEVKPLNSTYDYHVASKSKLISSKKSNSVPFLTKSYSVPVDERMVYWDAWDTMLTLDENIVTFYDLNKEGTIIAATFHISRIVQPRHHKAGLLIPGLQKLMEEMHERGHKYFQIVYPAQISNYLGFPINKISDLSTYFIPELDNPHDSNILFRYDMDLMSGRGTRALLEDGTTRLVIKIVDKPKIGDIVWNVEENLDK